MSSHDREDYVISARDITNTNANHSLYEALEEINSIYSGKMTINGFESKIQEQIDKEIADGKMKYDEAKKKKNSKTKRFKKVKTAFKIALKDAIECAKNIERIDDICSVLDDIISLRNNKNNTKESEQLISEAKALKTQLKSYRKKLEKQAVKSIDKARKMDVKVRSYRNSVPSYEQLSSSEENFISEILREAKTVEKVTKVEKLEEKLEEKNESIEKSYEGRKEYNEKDVKDLEEKMRQVEERLFEVEDKEIKKEIRKETASIRRVIKPKTMSMSKENLEKMKKSEQLQEDIQMIQNVFSTVVPFSPKGIIGNAVRKKFDRIKQRMQEIWKIEEEKQRDLDQEQMDIDKKVRFATEATNAYDTVIDQSLEKQNIQRDTAIKNDKIMGEIADLDVELGEYQEHQGETYEQSVEVIGGEPRTVTGQRDYSEQMKETREEIDAKKEEIKENKQEKERIEKKKVEIPERYKDMKKKLQASSNLVQAVTAQTLGGMRL